MRHYYTSRYFSTYLPNLSKLKCTKSNLLFHLIIYHSICQRQLLFVGVLNWFLANRKIATHHTKPVVRPNVHVDRPGRRPIGIRCSAWPALHICKFEMSLISSVVGSELCHFIIKCGLQMAWCTDTQYCYCIWCVSKQRQLFIRSPFSRSATLFAAAYIIAKSIK